MKRKILALAVGVLLVLVFPSSCADKEAIKKEAMPGGIKDWSRTDAPKFIESKDLERFECEFGFQERQEEGYFYAIFEMVGGDQAAQCRMVGFDGSRPVLKLDFEAPSAALGDLQTLVDQHDLAKHNGLDRVANGLPERTGFRLLVEYASGEHIYAYDNTRPILDYRAEIALHEFFRGLAREAGLLDAGQEGD